MSRLGLKTGDQVIVMRGKDAGKKGKVTQVFPRLGKIVVEGANSMTKNVRARKSNDQGQRVQFFAPIDRSNVMLIDNNTGKPTRRRQSATTSKPSEPSIPADKSITPPKK